MSAASAPIQVCDHEDGCDQWGFDIYRICGRYLVPSDDPLHTWRIDRTKDEAYCPEHKEEGR